jgi:hypothetical protein
MQVRYPLDMRRVKSMLFVLLCSPVLTSIVNAATISPPEPSIRKTPAAWMGLMLMLVFFGIVIGVSLISSKRGHQD